MENIDLKYDDYAQSANTIFNFMKKSKYLKEILQKKAIIPRYCKESLEYLNIHNGDIAFPEALVLQKCFCDIPFHKFTESFHLNPVGENYQSLSNDEKKRIKNSYTHTDFYGEYGIAFSKEWGEKNNLQPVHYLNEQSQYTRHFTEIVEEVLNADNVSDSYVDDILDRLCFIKPLRGIMKRKSKKETGEEVEVEFQKNFHDEKEWRYVPSREAVSNTNIERVVANQYILESEIDINCKLNTEQYEDLWLHYNYEDIRYIVVPDASARIDIINTILNISEEKFSLGNDVITQKYILISKILVLEEIRKDW